MRNIFTVSLCTTCEKSSPSNASSSSSSSPKSVSAPVTLLSSTRPTSFTQYAARTTPPLLLTSTSCSSSSSSSSAAKKKDEEEEETRFRRMKNTSRVAAAEWKERSRVAFLQDAEAAGRLTTTVSRDDQCIAAKMLLEEAWNYRVKVAQKQLLTSKAAAAAAAAAQDIINERTTRSSSSSRQKETDQHFRSLRALNAAAAKVPKRSTLRQQQRPEITASVMERMLLDVQIIMTSQLWDDAQVSCCVDRHEATAGKCGSSTTPQTPQPPRAEVKQPYLFTTREIFKMNLFNLNIEL